MLEQFGDLFTSGKNFLSALHDANIEAIVWLTTAIGVTLEPWMLTLIEMISFILIGAMLMRFIGASFKHALIISAIIIVAIMLIPIF